MSEELDLDIVSHVENDSRCERGVEVYAMPVQEWNTTAAQCSCSHLNMDPHGRELESEKLQHAQNIGLICSENVVRVDQQDDESAVRLQQRNSGFYYSRNGMGFRAESLKKAHK